MANIMIVVGHSQRDTFCEALGHAYQRGAQSAGHTAALFVLSRMNFDPILRGGYRELQPLEPDLEAARAALWQCDHVVIIFPLWLGDMPAIFKGFLERIMQPALLEKQASGRRRQVANFREKIRAHRYHHGHAGFCLSLVVRRPCAETAQALYPAFHRHQAGAHDDLWRHREDVGGKAAALACRN